MSKKKSPLVKVGCCGFGGAMSTYIEHFDVVEVQHTFYEPPQAKTLERWRADAPDNFEFTLKAWQLITHEGKSPTYRRLKRELTEKERTECGAFRNTKIVKEAWQKTLECAELLDAKRILFQCPASFKPTDENIRNMRKFFTKLAVTDHDYYWEPRGKAWTPELVRSICAELGLYHAVDPFTSEGQTPEETYFRLHGKGGWRYVYTDDDLSELSGKLPSSGTAYVLFNNIRMRENAESFTQLLL